MTVASKYHGIAAADKQNHPSMAKGGAKMDKDKDYDKGGCK